MILQSYILTFLSVECGKSVQKALKLGNKEYHYRPGDRTNLARPSIGGRAAQYTGRSAAGSTRGKHRTCGLSRHRHFDNLKLPLWNPTKYARIVMRSAPAAPGSAAATRLRAFTLALECRPAT